MSKVVMFPVLLELVMRKKADGDEINAKPSFHPMGG